MFEIEGGVMLGNLKNNLIIVKIQKGSAIFGILVSYFRKIFGMAKGSPEKADAPDPFKLYA